MDNVVCTFYSRFDKIYEKWSVQRTLKQGNLFETLGEIERFPIVGRKHHEENPEAPLMNSIILREEPENPMDKDAIAVHIKGRRIGYIPHHLVMRVRELEGKTKDEDPVEFVNSTTAIYVINL